jgi:hypothetical protein
MDLASNDSASPLAQGKRIEVRGFSSDLNGYNPHPPGGRGEDVVQM